MKGKLLMLGFLGLILFSSGFMANAEVEGLDKEGFNVSQTAFDDFSIVVHCFDLEEGNVYNIISSPDEGTTNTTEVDWKAGSDGEDTFYFSCTTPADKTLEIYLKDTTDAESEYQTVYFPDDDDVLNSDSMTNYVILVALIVIPILLVKGLMRGFR